MTTAPLPELEEFPLELARMESRLTRDLFRPQPAPARFAWLGVLRGFFAAGCVLTPDSPHGYDSAGTPGLCWCGRLRLEWPHPGGRRLPW